MTDVFEHTNNNFINNVYKYDDNYKIVENKKNTLSCTVVYFSSNGIYFPNTLETFKDKIIVGDKYEWSKYENQIKNVKKSIFIRDVYKQWYLKGINTEINNIDKLIQFIVKEHDQDNLILVGISSGGFIATLIGAKLNADMVFNFAGQLTLESILAEGKDKIVNNSYSTWKQYYNLSELLKNTKTTIFYYVCSNSNIDQEHIAIAKKSKKVYMFLFDCDAHGIPFHQTVLKYLLQINKSKHKKLSQKYFDTLISPSLFWRNFTNPIQYFISIGLYVIKNLSKLPKYIIYKILK